MRIHVAALQHLAHRLAPRSRLLRAWRLKGGISARMTAFEIEQPGGRTERLVLRQPGAANLTRNPSAAADTFELLAILSAAGLPVPSPRYLDESRELLPDPYLVIDYVEGDPEYAPANPDNFVFQLASQLARIHALDGACERLLFLPRLSDHVTRILEAPPAALDLSLDEDRIRSVLERAWPLAQGNEPGLLHGDFWPGNVLWKEGGIVAVIDWEDAAIGDPLYDVAVTRLDLLWVLGATAMEAFTARYLSMSRLDVVNLPCWDLFAALRPAGFIAEWAEAWPELGRPDITEARMRDEHQSFVAQAIEKLSKR